MLINLSSLLTSSSWIWRKLKFRVVNCLSSLVDPPWLLQVFEGLKRPLDPYDCFHIEVVDQIVEKTFIELSRTDPIENSDALTAQTKTIEVMYLDDSPDM
ncbi:hypothetical protein L3X38_042390 [Prunus dulcis]|uniref:Uncharacterized protein n=1 Tax=Prunus dulcis TaxID=3755 RepID=A0AAD4UWI4_PRUDU|nr:hypothetical protein L3X38_042390 [Prunus dulcis]